MLDGVEGDHLAGDPHCFFSGNCDDVGGATGFAAAFGERFALFAADCASEVFDAFAHERGGPAEDFSAAVSRQLPHRDSAGLQHGERGVDVGRNGERLGTEVVGAIELLAEAIVFDVDALLLDPDSRDDVDPRDFVEALIPISASLSGIVQIRRPIRCSAAEERRP